MYIAILILGWVLLSIVTYRYLKDDLDLEILEYNDLPEIKHLYYRASHRKIIMWTIFSPIFCGGLFIATIVHSLFKPFTDHIQNK